MTRAEEFVQKLETDSELKSQLSRATSSEEANRVVADAGFGDVSADDVRALNQNDELSDSELAGAAGGIGFWFGGGGVDIGINL